MKKFKNLNTNIVIVGAVVFITIFLSTSGSLASALATKDISYFFVGLLGWGTQFFVSCLVLLIGLAFVKLFMLLSNLKERKNESK